jgi:hypothetical protein
MIKWHPGTQVVPTGTRCHWQYPVPRYPPLKGVPVPDRLGHIRRQTRGYHHRTAKKKWPLTPAR